MSRRTWVRRPAEWRETFGAAAVGAGVGGVVFWLLRTLLARDPVGRPRSAEEVGSTQGGEGAAP